MFTFQVPDGGRTSKHRGVWKEDGRSVASSGRDIFAARQFAQHGVPTKRSVLLAEAEHVSGSVVPHTPGNALGLSASPGHTV